MHMTYKQTCSLLSKKPNPKVIDMYWNELKLWSFKKVKCKIWKKLHTLENS
jgi:hypothetical protein